MPTSAHKLSWFVAIAFSVIVSSALPHTTIAQDIEPDEVEIIRVKLDLDGPNNEWVRIERRGDLVKLVHTKRSPRRKGAGGVANFLIDTVGPSNLAFSDWDDHQTTRTLFEPDDCSDLTREVRV